MEKFNHDCSRDLQVKTSMLDHIRSQHLDYFLVLDLEGKIEILEFPVLIIDAKTMNVVDFFHRFDTLPPDVELKLKLLIINLFPLLILLWSHLYTYLYEGKSIIIIESVNIT